MFGNFLKLCFIYNVSDHQSELFADVIVGQLNKVIRWNSLNENYFKIFVAMHHFIFLYETENVETQSAFIHHKSNSDSSESSE